MAEGHVSKAVLITGCSTGIGRATAQQLARRGHRVYATARRLDSIEDLRDAGCEVLALDVTDAESMAQAVKTVEEAEGAVGALVNNAGYSQGGAVETLTMDAIRRQFETNVFGLIELTKLCLPAMRAQGWGRIVNVSSMGGRFTFPGGGAYHASKHAVEAFSDALRQEVKGFGIRVSIIEPGVVFTAFADAHASAIGEAAEEGPYAQFNAAVSARIDAAYTGILARLGGSSPEKVARVIERAITNPYSKPRYRVGRDARSAIIIRRALPDRAVDAILRRAYVRPPS